MKTKRTQIKINLALLMPDDRAMFLAYDQGMEHGPRDFEGTSNQNPLNILAIAKHGGFTGLVLLPGLAEQYYSPSGEKRFYPPLILKTNCKSELSITDPYSPLLYSDARSAVNHALKLDASAVGYTVYLGSRHESAMFQEFASLSYEAHMQGLAVIGWIYPRSNAWEEYIIRRKRCESIREIAPSLQRAIDEALGNNCPIDETPTMAAYAARAGAELGADIVKIKYCQSVPGHNSAFAWAVQCAFPTRVVMSGGPKMETDRAFLQQVSLAMNDGAAGIAVGRNVWQSGDSVSFSKKLHKAIFGF